MIYKAKFTVSSEIHKKHIHNVITKQNFLMLNLVVRKETGRL
jgi:predicted transcriptional regulator